MEFSNITDFGILGLCVLLTFQYIIRPIVTATIERRKNTEDHIPEFSVRMQDMVTILTKRDGKQRPIVWGFCIKEAIEDQTRLIEELISAIKDLSTKLEQGG